MTALHECPYCHYRFEDRESLTAHLTEGRGCPETTMRDQGPVAPIGKEK